MNKIPKIIYETDDGIAILTINRPERRNALDGETLEMLNSCMDKAESDNEIKAIIINGRGNTFSSGFDLKDQLDMLYHDIKSGNLNNGKWITAIDAVKEKFPKPSEPEPDL